MLPTRPSVYVERLSIALGGLTSMPAVGQIALVIFKVLEVILIANKEVPLDTGDMLRPVFAEEKASAVRNWMDEYLKLVQMDLETKLLLLENTKRVEGQLSSALT
ncbi:unnamed protein product [Coregonus sp. 'balchen']|nr:unnamed protein product [Coregonus sp. 'balchen']